MADPGPDTPRDASPEAHPIPFDNSFARLPERLFVRQAPVPVAAPERLVANAALARDLGIEARWFASEEAVQAFAGNRLPGGAEPIAQAYAGHQFGGWVPQLGDGRAVLLGEVVDSTGIRRDIQLKGAGRTPFSRGGDGRAWLGPVLREYVVSEAMHALGIPTTRALFAVATGETVVRETPLPGAILTRVASSHLRVGTFQYFAARRDEEALAALTEHAIARHYPEAGDALGLLNAVVDAQARLIAAWMSVGFIHGVMNTDNMAISGETIDYGPCAFIDAYHKETVFSSIDRMGRYAYGNQPDMAVWNLAQLATSLLPLMGPRDAAIEKATEAVHRFPALYAQNWLRLFGRKIGIETATAQDAPLIEAFLKGLQDTGADFTNSFRALASGTIPTGLETWATDWRKRLETQSRPQARMLAANPAFIPRNHRIEEMIEAARRGDLAPLERLGKVLATPYDDQPENADLALPPAPGEEVLQTFCGT